MRLLEEMHLVTRRGDKVLRGFEAVRWLAWRLPPLWPAALILSIPGMNFVGVPIYCRIARNRFGLMPCRKGVCSNGSNR